MNMFYEEEHLTETTVNRDKINQELRVRAMRKRRLRDDDRSLISESTPDENGVIPATVLYKRTHLYRISSVGSYLEA